MYEVPTLTSISIIVLNVYIFRLYIYEWDDRIVKTKMCQLVH